MQQGEGFGKWPEALEYELLQARVCVDNILSIVPLHSVEGWTVHTLRDLLGGVFPSDDSLNYVFMGFALEPDNVPEDAQVRPGILVRAKSQSAVYDTSTGRLTNTPDSDPNSITAYLSTRIGRTLFRYSHLHPMEEQEELEIPVRYISQSDSSSRLTLDFEAIKATDDAAQTLFLQFAKPLVSYVLPIVASRN
jgi:hypothetical protein